MVLLIKYLLLSGLSIILGVLLGRWWIRRRGAAATDDQIAATAQPGDQKWDKLWRRLDLLDGGVAPLSNHDASVQAATGPDLAAIVSRLDRIEDRLAQQRGPTHDLSPIGERIADLERYVRTLPRTHHQLDLSPIKFRLSAIETLLKTDYPKASEPASLKAHNRTAIRSSSAVARSKHPSPARTPVQTAMGLPPARNPDNDGPPLFATNSSGVHDDLKKITGIGPKLATLLNSNGVYYFWQIASWDDTDVAFIDERMGMFKGRIDRDDWVEQARTLQALPGAAQPSKPTESR